jgi:hypothetical protein
MCVTIDGVWIGEWIYQQLYKSLHAKSSQSAFTSRFLLTNLNNGHSSAPVVMLLPAG